MSRFFYTVSRKHHAVSMAIDFGMRFKLRNGFWTPEGLLAITGAPDYRIEISEESQHLLEPQDGDLFHLEGGFIQYRIVRSENHDFRLVCDLLRSGHGKIIQRGSISFHWPEVNP